MVMAIRQQAIVQANGSIEIHSSGLTPGQAVEVIVIVEPAVYSTLSPQPRLIRDLGWTDDEAWETAQRFLPFQEDWDAPGMEAYDNL